MKLLMSPIRILRTEIIKLEVARGLWWVKIQLRNLSDMILGMEIHQPTPIEIQVQLEGEFEALIQFLLV